MISVENLSKSFGELRVLNNLNFEIKPGEFIAVYGPNGCGKTTLLNCIGGIIDYNGKINISNKSPNSSKISMVFQSYSDSIFPWNNVLENVAFPLEVNNVPRSKNIAKNFLKNTKLKDYIYYYPYQLSGGLQQLVSIIRAFLYKPEVILLDEPFTSLDKSVKDDIKSELIELWKKTNSTIIFVTHDIDEAISLADRVLVLSNKPSRILKIINVHKIKNLTKTKNEILKKLK